MNIFSFMLEVKSIGYKRSRNARLFLCAASSDEVAARRWIGSLESVMNSSYVFRGIEEDARGTRSGAKGTVYMLFQVSLPY